MSRHGAGWWVMVMAAALVSCTAFSDLPQAPDAPPSPDAGLPDADLADGDREEDAEAPDAPEDAAPTDADASEDEPDAATLPDCGQGAARCDGVCVNTNSINRCGGCDPCVPGPNSVAVACDEGQCRFECAGDTVDLDDDQGLGRAGTGCECVVRGEELCNGLDDDCDGDIDEGVTNACGACEALDGQPGDPCGDAPCFGALVCNEDGTALVCQGGGQNACGGCAPLEGQPEDPCLECGQLTCDGPDALACVEARRLYFKDSDGDGFGDPGTPSRPQCGPEEEFTALIGQDCDDLRAEVHPGADELCDGLDNDCDQRVDENPLGVNELCGALRCGFGESRCRNGALLCDFDGEPPGRDSTIPVENGLIRAHTGTRTPGFPSYSVHISSDGAQLYNVAFGIDGNTFAGWTVRVFTAEPGRLAFVREVIIPVQDMPPIPFAGVAAIGPRRILAFNVSDGNPQSKVWALNLDTEEAAPLEVPWGELDSNQGGAEYDWLRQQVWTITFDNRPPRVTVFPEDALDQGELFTLDPQTGRDGVVASDGVNLYTMDYTLAPNADPTPLRIHTPRADPRNGFTTDIMANLPAAASITFHGDGYLYIPIQNDLTRIRRVAATVGGEPEVCDGVDNDCDGEVDNLPECLTP